MSDQKHHTTREDRRKELKVLLDKVAAHPEHDMTAERARIAVLKQVLAD